MSALTDAVQAFVDSVVTGLQRIPANGSLIAGGGPSLPFNFVEGFPYTEMTIVTSSSDTTIIQNLGTVTQYIDITTNPVRLYSYNLSVWSYVDYTGNLPTLRRNSFCRSPLTGRTYYFNNNLIPTEFTFEEELTDIVEQEISPWTARPAIAENPWYSITYGNSLFVAVAASGTNQVMTSPDGITWTARTAANNNPWQSVCFGNGLFVAVAYDGVGNRVMTSPDGITWTARTSAADNVWDCVCYGNGLFVAVASTGTNRVMTSPDGITWTVRNAAVNSQWHSVTYGNGIFVAVGSSGDGLNLVMTSANGINWTIRNSPVGYWQSITYGNGLFIAVGDTSLTSNIMSSPDGITWTNRYTTETTQKAWQSVCFGNGLFVAVSFGGSNRAMTSSDGITWVAELAAVQNIWISVTFGNNRFVAVAYGGTSNRVMSRP